MFVQQTALECRVSGSLQRNGSCACCEAIERKYLPLEQGQGQACSVPARVHPSSLDSGFPPVSQPARSGLMWAPSLHPVEMWAQGPKAGILNVGNVFTTSVYQTPTL